MAKKISAAFAIIIIAAFAIFVGFMSWIWCNYDNLEVYNNTMSRSYQKDRKSCIREGEGISTVLLPDGARGQKCCDGLTVIPIEGNADDAGYCTKCGDKLCKVPENEGNCPTDCGGEIVGNDRDEHDCIGSAGYTWCEEKQKCLRSWEESCESISDQSMKDWKNYINDTYGFEFKYPAEFVNLINGTNRPSFVVPENNVLYNEIIETKKTGVFDAHMEKKINVTKSIRVVVWNHKWEVEQEISIPHDSYFLDEKDKKITSNIPNGYFMLGPHSFMGTSCESKEIYIPYENKTIIISISECGDESESEDMPSPPSESKAVINKILSQIIPTFKFIK